MEIFHISQCENGIDHVLIIFIQKNEIIQMILLV